jgi:hypothetical protein
MRKKEIILNIIFLSLFVMYIGVTKGLLAVILVPVIFFGVPFICALLSLLLKKLF